MNQHKALKRHKKFVQDREAARTQLAAMTAERDGLLEMYRKVTIEQRSTTIWAQKAEEQLAEALTVLDPAVPGQGLVDAARQVKQVAISEAANAEELERQLKQANTEIARLQALDEDRNVQKLRTRLRTKSAELEDAHRKVREQGELLQQAAYALQHANKDMALLGKEPMAEVHQEERRIVLTDEAR